SIRSTEAASNLVIPSVVEGSDTNKGPAKPPGSFLRARLAGRRPAWLEKAADIGPSGGWRERMSAVIASSAADAYAIFQRTRSAVTAARYPQRIDYTITVSGEDGSTPRTNHYVASYGDSGSVLVSSISQEEAANPTTPRGTNLSIHFYLSGGAGS